MLPARCPLLTQSGIQETAVRLAVAATIPLDHYVDAVCGWHSQDLSGHMSLPPGVGQGNLVSSPLVCEFEIEENFREALRNT